MSTEIRPTQALPTENPPTETLPAATHPEHVGEADLTVLTSPGRFGVRPKVLWALLIANGAVWMTFFPVILTAMPAKIKLLSPDDYTTALSVALTISSLVGMVAGPVIGHLSDRSTSRFGRRRPWLVGSLGIGIVGNLLVGFAPSVAVFTLGTVVTQIGFGGAAALQLALLPDHVPAGNRGAVGALLGVSTAVATVIGVGITGALSGQGQIGAAFVAVSVIGVLGVAYLCAVLPDVQHPTAEKINLAGLARAFWVSPRRYPDFAWGWLSRFAVYLALASVTTYQLFYLTDQLRIDESRAAAVFVPLGVAVQTLATVVGAVLGGPLSDRVGRRKPFVAAAAGVAFVGLVILAFATAIPAYLAGILLIGLALGTYVSVDIALITAVLPSELDAGKDLGVLNIANTLPNSLAPAFAPVLLGIGLFSAVAENDGRNYTMLFLGSAVFALVSVLSVLKIRSVR